MPATARHIGQAAEAARAHAARYQTPESNVWLGTWYLNQLLERYDGQVVAAIGAYNGGPSAMDRWLEAFDGMPLDEFVERIPYRETRRYVRRVVETWSIYEQLYGGAAPELPDAIAHVVDTESHASF
jgi:soluble lytic murein transglycosylase